MSMLSTWEQASPVNWQQPLKKTMLHVRCMGSVRVKLASRPVCKTGCDGGHAQKVRGASVTEEKYEKVVAAGENEIPVGEEPDGEQRDTRNP